MIGGSQKSEAFISFETFEKPCGTGRQPVQKRFLHGLAGACHELIKALIWEIAELFALLD